MSLSWKETAAEELQRGRECDGVQWVSNTNQPFQKSFSEAKRAFMNKQTHKKHSRTHTN
jgi:hypothetical protein